MNQFTGKYIYVLILIIMYLMIYVGVHSVNVNYFLCSDLDQLEFHLHCYLNQGKEIWIWFCLP